MDSVDFKKLKKDANVRKFRETIRQLHQENTFRFEESEKVRTRKVFEQLQAIKLSQQQHKKLIASLESEKSPGPNHHSLLEGQQKVLQELYVRKDELKLDYYFGDPDGKWKFRACPEDGFYLAACDLGLEKVTAEYNITLEAHGRVIVDVKQICAVLQIYKFRMKGKKAGKLLPGLFKPKRIAAEVTGGMLLDLMYTPGEPQSPSTAGQDKDHWKVVQDKFKLELHTQVKGGAMSIPDKLINWILNSFVPKQVQSAIVESLPLKLGPHLKARGLKGHIKGDLTIVGSMPGDVWTAALDGNSASSKIARQLLSFNGQAFPKERAQLVAFVSQACKMYRTKDLKTVSLEQLYVYSLKYSLMWEQLVELWQELLDRQPGLKFDLFSPRSSLESISSFSVDDPSSEKIIALAEKFRACAKVEDRTHHLHRYPACFVGKEVVEDLVATGVVPNNAAALALGNTLMEMGLFVHVVNQHRFKAEHLFYRFSDSFDRVLGRSSFSQSGSQFELTGEGPFEEKLTKSATAAAEDSRQAAEAFAAEKGDGNWFGRLIAQVKTLAKKHITTRFTVRDIDCTIDILPTVDFIADLVLDSLQPLPEEGNTKQAKAFAETLRLRSEELEAIKSKVNSACMAINEMSGNLSAIVLGGQQIERVCGENAEKQDQETKPGTEEEKKQKEQEAVMLCNFSDMKGDFELPFLTIAMPHYVSIFDAPSTSYRLTPLYASSCVTSRSLPSRTSRNESDSFTSSLVASVAQLSTRENHFGTDTTETKDTNMVGAPISSKSPKSRDGQEKPLGYSLHMDLLDPSDLNTPQVSNFVIAFEEVASTIATKLTTSCRCLSISGPISPFMGPPRFDRARNRNADCPGLVDDYPFTWKSENLTEVEKIEAAPTKDNELQLNSAAQLDSSTKISTTQIEQMKYLQHELMQFKTIRQHMAKHHRKYGTRAQVLSALEDMLEEWKKEDGERAAVAVAAEPPVTVENVIMPYLSQARHDFRLAMNLCMKVCKPHIKSRSSYMMSGKQARPKYHRSVRLTSSSYRESTRRGAILGKPVTTLWGLVDDKRTELIHPDLCSNACLDVCITINLEDFMRDVAAVQLAAKTSTNAEMNEMAAAAHKRSVNPINFLTR